MNKLYPYRPGYIDIGPLPPAEEFISLEEMYNTKWLTDHMRLDRNNESIVIRNIQIESGNPSVIFYWVMLKNETKDQYTTIGKLDTLEYVTEDMIIDEKEFALYVERMKARAAAFRKERLENRHRIHIIKN